jgi:hypothetical protein
VKAPAAVVDLDDVAHLDALEPHCRAKSSMNLDATRPPRWRRRHEQACAAPSEADRP